MCICKKFSSSKDNTDRKTTFDTETDSTTVLRMYYQLDFPHQFQPLYQA